MKVLLADDDEDLVRSLRRGLEAEGFTVDVAHTGVDAIWIATQSAHDVIVLDVMMPEGNGFRVCAQLRAEEVWTPILMLTAKSGDFDQAEALDTGADDYLTKPFSYPVLLARLRALGRRTRDSHPAPSNIGDLRIDPAARRAWRGSTEIELTSRQFQVLEFIVRRAGDVVSKTEILDGVWEHDFDGDPNIVEVYIRRLRRAVDEPFGRQTIETVRGAGYRVVDDRA